ncbi:MAG: PD-(D/E)XK nuclease family protein [Clostridia bacterium]|nr:PD-(D/E)XK nuclease family protein [Clostridia bacterium]
MDKFFENLKKICDKHLFGKKILIMPSYASGWQVIHAAAKRGISCINLNVHTLEDLCIDKCSTYIQKNNISLATSTLCWHYMIQVLEELKESQQLQYFDSLKITSDLAKSFYKAILDFKMANITPANIQQHHFISPKKYNDIKKIYLEYQNTLKREQKADIADLYAIASRLNDKNKEDAIYILPDNTKLNHIQTSFLNSITDKDYLTLPLNPSKDVEYARINMDAFTAYGETNEVREVLRRIKTGSIPFEDVAIYCTDSGNYTRLFHDTCSSLDIPFTCGTGFEVKTTRPGRLVYGLMDWISNQYNVWILYSMLYNKELYFSHQQAPSCLEAVDILRRAKIGWHKKRYITCLTKLEHCSKDKKVKYLLDVFKDIFDLLPDSDGTGLYDYSQFTKGLAQVVKDYSYIDNALDQQAEEEIIRRLVTVSEDTCVKLSMAETIQRIQSMLSDIKIGAASPKPGHIYITNYQAGPWADRPFNFIIGMDSGRFPGMTAEDAILLDKERDKISSNLEIKSIAYKDNIDAMDTLIANLKGKLTMSCSSYEIQENRAKFPSSYFIRMWKDYCSYRGQDSPELSGDGPSLCGFIPKSRHSIIDENEWWLNAYFLQGAKNVDFSVIDTYFPSLAQGLKSLNARKSPEFTQYDGNISIHSEFLDPRENKDLVMSCGKIEQLAACPYSFFLKYILGLQQADDLLYDPSTWLDPLNRGLLLHSIFEKFVNNYLEKGINTDIREYADTMYEMADELIADYKEQIPPIKDVVFQNQRKEIHDCCQVFLNGERERLENQMPCYLELDFGYKTQDGGLPPALIQLPSGKSFYLSGRIDRVDRTDQGQLIIIDYKTGSFRNYDANDYFKGGRQIQHAVYSAAVEKILSEKQEDVSHQVKSAGYIFPTIRGEGQCIMYPQDKRQEVFILLDTLLDILAKGLFIMTESGGDCRICEYGDICRRQDAEPVLAQKAADSCVPELECVRQVKTYEQN